MAKYDRETDSYIPEEGESIAKVIGYPKVLIDNIDHAKGVINYEIGRGFKIMDRGSRSIKTTKDAALFASDLKSVKNVLVRRISEQLDMLIALSDKMERNE